MVGDLTGSAAARSPGGFDTLSRPRRASKRGP